MLLCLERIVWYYCVLFRHVYVVPSHKWTTTRVLVVALEQCWNLFYWHLELLKYHMTCSTGNAIVLSEGPLILLCIILPCMCSSVPLMKLMAMEQWLGLLVSEEQCLGFSLMSGCERPVLTVLLCFSITNIYSVTVIVGLDMTGH